MQKKNQKDNNNQDFKTASRQYDKTSYVPSKKGSSNAQPTSKEEIAQSAPGNNGFIKSIKSIFKPNQTNYSRKDQYELRPRGQLQSSNHSTIKRPHIDFAGEKQKTGASALKYMEEKQLRQTQLKRRNQLRTTQNPFQLKEKRQDLQSKVKIIAPQQTSGNDSKASKNYLKNQFEPEVNSSKAFLKTSQADKNNSNKFSNDDKIKERFSNMKEESLSSDSFNFKSPDDDDDSGDDPIFQDKFNFQKSKAGMGHSKVKGTVANSTFNMVALEKILEASNIYQDYLTTRGKSKRASIFQAEFNLIEKPKLPQEFYFKPERVFFNKIKEDLPFDYNYHGYHVLCKMNKTRNKLYYQDLKVDQLKNMRGLKVPEISFPRSLKMNFNVEYDHDNKRFFTYSNKEQKIFVFSQATQDPLCKIAVNRKVFDPHLFLHHISGRSFLMVIGGYQKIEKNVVQGSKYIEIFELRKWDIEIKSQTVKLSIGRINPIIMHINQKNQSKILILGGNTIASIDSNQCIEYDYEDETNESTNQSGTSIASEQILQLFDINEPPITTLHPVKTNQAKKLHNGCVIPINNTFLILLPDCKHLMQVKIMNKQINLIEGQPYKYIPWLREIQRRQVCIQLKEQGIVIYKISEKGIFEVISQDDRKADRCQCSIF